MNGLGMGLERFFTITGAAWTATGFIGLLVIRMWSGAPAVFAQWVAYRRAKAEERSADWTRLRDENARLDGRCQRLEIAEEKCRDELADVKQRLSALEGYELGKGKARQDAANIVAIERLQDEKKDLET
jgi:Tfp pilus assembly protein PilN